MGKKRWNKPLVSVLATAVLSAQVLGGIFTGSLWGANKAEAAASGGSLLPKIDLRLIGTTDVHTNVYGWDYFKNAPSTSVGLARTATLIKAAKLEQPNNLLLDNGDLIQGTPLGTYEAKIEPVTQAVYDSKPHPMIAALNALEYDAATFGNHEFNYGLEFLDRTINGSSTDSVKQKLIFLISMRIFM